MSPVGSRSLFALVVGEEPLGGALSGRDDESRRSLAADVVDAETVTDPGTVSDDERLGRDVDCLVVDSGAPGVDSTAVVEQWVAERPHTPVVLLVDDWDDDRVANALSAGATETLPRRLVETDPDLLAGRVAAAAERRLLERERDRRSVLFENNPDPVMRVEFEDEAEGDDADERADEEPIIREVNPAFEDVFGYPAGEVVGSTVAQAVVPESERAEHERFSDRVARGESVEAQAQRQTADGVRQFRFRVIHFSTDPAADAATDAYVWYTDVTERKRREREYEQLFDGVNDSITVHDPETAELLDVNEAFCDLLGYDREEILDMGIEGYSPSDEGYTMEQAREFVSAVVDSGEPRQTEWVVETSDGEKRWLEVKGTTVELGGELRYVSIDRDVTERKRREREYEQIFDGVNEAIVVQDPETARILDANQTFLDRLGYDTVEQIREVGFDELSASDAGYTRERAQELCQRVMETGEPETVEWQQETRSGERRWIEAKVDSAVIRGEDRILSMQRDVTERKRRERMIRTLHEATDDLQDAETPEAVCEAAIDAATEVLDLWLPTCWLHDAGGESEESGETGTATLTPAASGDETEDLPPAAGPRDLEPGDLEYEVYEGGERRICDPDDLDGGTPPGDALLFPLGDHGLFGAVERESEREGDGDETPGGFDDVTLDAAGILARHVTSALDRVERARKLRESERRFRLIADHIDEIVYVSTADFSAIRYINDAYEEIYGRPVSELAAEPTSFVEAAHPDDRAEYEADVERLIADVEAGDPQDAYEGEYRIERDGETRWVSVTRFPVENDEGVVDRIVGRVQDVTERKRREREYEQIFDNVTDAIAVHDPETGEFVDVNDTYVEQFGYDLDAIRDLGIEGLSVSEEGFTETRGNAILERVAERGESETVEWQVRHADGEERVYEVNATAATIGGEERVLTINHDITERRRREREYEQIFNGVSDAISVHDPETGDILEVNDSMAELTGYDREELLSEGQSLINVAEQGYSTERSRAIIREVMETGEQRTLDWLIERKDGERRWLEVTTTPTTLNGEPRYLGILRDVTERRRTERRLRAVVERIDQAIYLTRADEITDPTVRSHDLSAGYEQLWGQSLDELFANNEDGFFGTLHPDERAEFEAFVEGIGSDVDEGTPADRYSREYRIERPDGETRWIRSEFYPTEWDTGPLRIVIVSRDITERKARERRIASFDDATDDLATADTPEEATRTAVDAAVETLDLPAVCAYLYDEDDGVLRPDVLAGGLPADVAAEPVEPGDGPLWDGFATGTIVASDGGRNEPGFVGGSTDDETSGSESGSGIAGSETPRGLDALEEWRGLALGNHGILLVGSPDSELGSEAIQAAHVLAATLEAALNHLEGRQRLEAREEELRTQTERADRLDRIARLTQQVEAAITDASTPGEVEQAVCERLASAGPYDLAWVGGVDVGTDQLAARSVVGAPERYVDSLDLTTVDESADPHPAVLAWRTDEVCVADSLVADGPAGNWRRRGLSEGFQALCAVPLTYDGITHGVLTVGTDSPGAFDEREREVLAQLGTSIANALAAIERRRALESDETVELEFRGTGENLSFGRAADATDCRVRLERTAARQDGSVSVYFSFEGDVPDGAADIATRTLPGAVDVVAEEESSVLVEARTDDWFGAPLAEYGGVLREASAEPGETTVVVEVPTQADIRSFVERLEEIAPSLELVAQRQHQGADRTPAELGDQVRTELTDRQSEVVRTALSAGYFQWPREHDGSEVAQRLDITQPTFNKHLRIAERKTFGLLFDADA